MPWPLWLNWLSHPWSERSGFDSLSGHMPGVWPGPSWCFSLTLMFLSFPFSLPSPLSKKKITIAKKYKGFLNTSSIEKKRHLQNCNYWILFLNGWVFFNFYFFNPYLKTCLLILESGEGRERESKRKIDVRETSFCTLTHQIPNPQPSYVRWPGNPTIILQSFWVIGWCFN